MIKQTQNTKVGREEYRRPTSIDWNVRSRTPNIGSKDLFGVRLRTVKKVGMMGVMIFAMAAVWVVLPTNGAEAAI